MKKTLVALIIVIFGVLVGLRIMQVQKESNQESIGIEQTYARDGFPVELAPVESKIFDQHIRVNANVNGIKQDTVVTNVYARVKKIHHQVGDQVEANEVIISLDKEDPRSSAMYRQQKAVYDTILKTYNRMLDLYERGAVSQSQFDEIKLKLDVEKANLEAIVETVNLSSATGGVILDIQAREGEMVTPNAPVATVARTDRVRLVASVSEDDIKKIRVGQQVVVESYNDSKSNYGKVSKLSLNANARSGLFKVEMDVDNRNKAMRIGTFTQAKIEIVNDPQAVVTDIRALQQDSDGSHYVFVLDGDRVRRVKVETQGQNDTLVRLKSGVSAGDRVVVAGTSRLADDTKVSF